MTDGPSRIDLGTRNRQLTDQLRQAEKLATLGKLTAGIAHDLNNPAAAAQRAAAQLPEVFSRLKVAHLKLAELGLSEEQSAHLQALDRTSRERARAPRYLDPVARADREAELETWLEETGIENAWDVAPSLVNVGFDRTELSRLTQILDGQRFLAAIDWLSAGSIVYSAAEEIESGTSRISEIVQALKEYTYLGQAPTQSIDVHVGLDNALIILGAKLRPGIAVQRDYDPDLPKIEAFGSELSQVWTNLIDNAIDAMEGKGAITLRTSHDGDMVVVEVQDNGPGVSSAIQSTLYDIFITTKGPGRGTGLGLSISRDIVVGRHGGTINVESQPGNTTFTIRLPIRRDGQ